MREKKQQHSKPGNDIANDMQERPVIRPMLGIIDLNRNSHNNLHRFGPMLGVICERHNNKIIGLRARPRNGQTLILNSVAMLRKHFGEREANDDA